MTSVSLRDATAQDVPAIAALHTANWRETYADILDPDYLAGPIEADRQTVWRARLTAGPPDLEVIVAENARGIVGFASLFHDRDPGWGGFVDNLHSAAEVRGQGVGKALLVEAARRVATRDPAKGLYLWVFERNETAVGFYRALGAEIAERIMSDWDKAPDEVRYRMHWPRAGDLASR
ncbi:GNAT family N-acetyltransferase [Alteriqipengyuania lutimaris]|uniref:GNAT family N-acetyltransferase n=1 Tax=Alteriqipengyuania lutimaris TaxID=1538146 RepID=UPI0015F1919B|nr:N-acetyltransferase [Alteriqipengyuania lutimaris]MBB3035016.1 ribosomal protein S18 acetylase RimI-like enzyme [Alteriqipengyuania lutimaris]